MNRPWLWFVLLGCLIGGGFIASYYRRQQHERYHDGVILAAAREYGVNAALVKAIVWQESSFDQKARGRAGEIGLMQITEVAAMEWADAQKLRSFEHRQLYDPGKNTRAGSWYLRKLLGRYKNTDNPMAYALADYNAGRSNVLRWNKGRAATNSMAFIKQIDFPSTKAYVRSVLTRYAHYKPTFPPSEKTK